MVMFCPKCNSNTLQVSNSRPVKRNNQVWRRRNCATCQNTFTTRESIDLSSIFRVRKFNNELEPYFRNKILVSLLRSLDHMQNSPELADALTDTVEAQLIRGIHEDIIPSREIAKVCLEVLKKFNTSAYVKYLSYQEQLDKRSLKKKL